MATLFLLRHAKSSWEDPYLADYDRPLAPRGEKAARRMAEHFRDEQTHPALVLCSPARRAADTFAMVRTGMDDDVEVRVEDNLYGAAAGDVLQRLRRVDIDVPSVMVVGHNPTLHDLANALAGDGEHTAMENLRLNFPTCALAVLDLGSTSWAELGRGDAYLSQFVLPRQLM